MVALTLLSSTFSLFLMTSGETETARQQRCAAVLSVTREATCDLFNADRACSGLCFAACKLIQIALRR